MLESTKYQRTDRNKRLETKTRAYGKSEEIENRIVDELTKLKREFVGRHHF